MFTIKQIEDAHSRVKTGADFPNYIKEIKELGVEGFVFWVVDGKEIFYSKNSNIQSASKYEELPISTNVNSEIFKVELLAHQQGKTNFEEFVQMCANTGITHWKVDLEIFTCTYFDAKNKEILIEKL